MTVLVRQSAGMNKTKEAKLAERLEQHVRALADLGERSTRRPAALESAAVYIENHLQAAGYAAVRQSYEAGGVTVSNIDARAPQLAVKSRHIVVGSHYDSAEGTPGADDNASAVALLLELAAAFRDSPEPPLRFVAFVNEEPPYFCTPLMGSDQFAARCVENGDNIAAMICLESLGIFTNEPGTQMLPAIPPEVSGALPDSLDPTVGNFVAIIINPPSWDKRLRTTTNGSIKPTRPDDAKRNDRTGSGIQEIRIGPLPDIT